MQACDSSRRRSRRRSASTPLAALLTGEVSVLDARGRRAAARGGGADVTALTRHHLLFEERTFATFLVYWSAIRRTAPLDLD